MKTRNHCVSLHIVEDAYKMLFETILSKTLLPLKTFEFEGGWFRHCGVRYMDQH
jgi:hypothetical protein